MPSQSALDGAVRARSPRSTEISESLKRSIMLGALAPGAPLLELELAGQFSCSQGSVREALLTLQEEGLVNRLPHRGTRVSLCTEPEAREMFRLRHGIETRGLARGFAAVGEARLSELRQLVQRMERAARDDDEYRLSEFDRQFHRLLFAAADLPALDPILHRCLVHNQRFKITRSAAVRDLLDTARRHWTILAAIEAGDRDAAVAAVGHHVATIVDMGPDLFPDLAEREARPGPPAGRPRPTAEMQAVLDRLAVEDAGQPAATELPPAEGRALSERRAARWQVDQPAMAEVRDVVVPADPELGSPAVETRVFRPDTPRPGAILFVHGGGFAFGSLASHERLKRLLARESRRPVIGLSYRLAPENPFPAGLHDVVAVWRAASRRPRDFGLAPGPMVIAGNSAGANLALAAMLHEAAAGLPLPVGALLLYGAFGTSFDTPSYHDFAEGYGLTAAAMRRYWDWYVPDPRARDDSLAAPLAAADAALAAMPPLYLLAAGLDPLASDTLMLKARLDRLGRRDRLRTEPGVIHGFLQMTPALAAAREAAAEAAEAAASFIDASS